MIFEIGEIEGTVHKPDFEIWLTTKLPFLYKLEDFCEIQASSHLLEIPIQEYKICQCMTLARVQHLKNLPKQLTSVSLIVRGKSKNN